MSNITIEGLDEVLEALNSIADIPKAKTALTKACIVV